MPLPALQISKISGGISNLLVKVTPPAPAQPVAVKVFGDKTELLIDREAEQRTLIKLAAQGFGAKVRCHACGVHESSTALLPVSGFPFGLWPLPLAPHTRPVRRCWPSSPTAAWRSSSTP